MADNTDPIDDNPPATPRRRKKKSISRRSSRTRSSAKATETAASTAADTPELTTTPTHAPVSPATDLQASTNEDTMADTNESTTDNAPAAELTSTNDEERAKRDQLAADHIKQAAKWAAGAGLIPIPVVDMLGILGLQVGLVRKLAGVHGVPFDEQRAKTLIGALLGSTAGHAVGKAIGRSVFKAIPGVRWVATLAAGPASGAAMTYVVGNSFHRHFRNGGTMENFDAVRDKCSDSYDAVRHTITGKSKQIESTESTQSV